MERKAALIDYVKNEIMRNPNAKLSDDQDLLGTGVLDSLAILQVVAFIDEQFGYQVPDEDVVFENFQSINALVSYLNGAK
jgi:acyl carrier protein